MATVDGIWSPDDNQEFDPNVDMATMAASIAARIAAASPPSGSIISYAGANAPSGWLLCQGQAVSRTTYDKLFAAIGTTYGAGDGSTTFNVPNLKGRVPVGTDSAQTEFTPLGKGGGAKTHKLSVAELPPHSHGFQKKPAGFVNNGVPSQVGGVDQSSNFADGATYNAGGGEAHNNLQPYLALHYIVKV